MGSTSHLRKWSRRLKGRRKTMRPWAWHDNSQGRKAQTKQRRQNNRQPRRRRNHSRRRARSTPEKGKRNRWRNDNWRCSRKGPIGTHQGHAIQKLLNNGKEVTHKFRKGLHPVS